MTSDAKIGLLLGLVFIFVIAFIINGLPNLRPQQATKADVSTMVGFPDQDIGVDGKAGTQADRDWKTLVNEQEAATETTPTPAEQTAAVAETPAPQTQTATAQEVRFEGPLPGAESPLPKVENPLTRIENILDRLTSQVAQNDQTVNMNVPSQSESPATVERQSPLPTTQPRTEVAAETTPQNTDQPKPAATQAAKPVVTTPKPTGKIYVVGEGETLSSVAKNVYGPEDGNRIANIRRIYEVNKDILKSEHEVVAGQKLVIPPALPPLPKVTTVNPDKPSDVLSKELFEKVEMIAKRPTASQTQTPTQTTTPPQAQKPAQTPVAATAGTRLYTVQDGDNLWKIASTQLGAGARYEEIAKLNADLLKDGAKLGVGMKIRLPQK